MGPNLRDGVLPGTLTFWCVRIGGYTHWLATFTTNGTGPFFCATPCPGSPDDVLITSGMQGEALQDDATVDVTALPPCILNALIDQMAVDIEEVLPHGHRGDPS